MAVSLSDKIPLSFVQRAVSEGRRCKMNVYAAYHLYKATAWELFSTILSVNFFLFALRWFFFCCRFGNSHSETVKIELSRFHQYYAIPHSTSLALHFTFFELQTYNIYRPSGSEAIKNFQKYPASEGNRCSKHRNYFFLCLQITAIIPTTFFFCCCHYCWCRRCSKARTSCLKFPFCVAEILCIWRNSFRLLHVLMNVEQCVFFIVFWNWKMFLTACAHV